jgi:hypothetical protein
VHTKLKGTLLFVLATLVLFELYSLLPLLCVSLAVKVLKG